MQSNTKQSQISAYAVWNRLGSLDLILTHAIEGPSCHWKQCEGRSVDRVFNLQYCFSPCFCTIYQIWQISLLPYLIQSLSYTKFGCCQPPLLLEYSKEAIIIGYPPKITLFHSQIVYFYKLNYRFTLYQQCKFYIVNVHIYLIHNMNLELEKLQSSLVDHVICPPFY